MKKTTTKSKTAAYVVHCVNRKTGKGAPHFCEGVGLKKAFAVSAEYLGKKYGGEWEPVSWFKATGREPEVHVLRKFKARRNPSRTDGIIEA